MPIAMIIKALVVKKLRDEAEKAALIPLVKSLEVSRHWAEDKIPKQKGKHQLVQPFLDIHGAVPANGIKGGNARNEKQKGHDKVSEGHHDDQKRQS